MQNNPTPSSKVPVEAEAEAAYQPTKHGAAPAPHTTSQRYTSGLVSTPPPPRDAGMRRTVSVMALSSKTTTNTTSDTFDRLFFDRRRFTEQTRFQSVRLYSSDGMHVVEAPGASAVPPLFMRALARHQVGAPIEVCAEKESEQAVHRTRTSQPAASPAARPTCTERHEHLAPQTPQRPRTPSERLFVDQGMFNEQPECLSPSPRFQPQLLHSSDRTCVVDAACASAAPGDGAYAPEGDAMELLHGGMLLEQLPQDVVQQVETLVQGPQSSVARERCVRLEQMQIRRKSGPRNRDEDPEHFGPSQEGMSDEKRPASCSALPPKPMPTLRIVATPRMYTPHYTPRRHNQKRSWVQDLLCHFKTCERLLCTCLLLPQVSFVFLVCVPWCVLCSGYIIHSCCSMRIIS